MEATNYLEHVQTEEYETCWIEESQVRVKKYVCFANLLQDSNQDEFTLIVYNNNIKNITTNHVVLLNKQQIIHYLGLLKRYFGGIESYSFVENDKNSVSVGLIKNNKEERSCKQEIKTSSLHIKINMKLLKLVDSDATRLVLYTHLRYLYEKPYNVILKQAFMLKDKYDQYSLMDWLLLSHIGKSYGYGHCLLVSSNLLYENRKPKASYIYKKFNINIIKNSDQKYSNNDIYAELSNLNTNSINKINKIFDNESISYRKP